MDNCIVIYDSFTRNTATIAENIAGELKCPAVSVKEFNNLPEARYDLIIMGSPVLSGKPTKKIITLLESLEKPQKCAVFCTYGAPVWGSISSRMALHFMKKRLAAPCLGTFVCPGLHVKFGTYKGRPDNRDFIKAREFAGRVEQKFRRQ